MPSNHRDEMVLSYSRVRNALGFLGLLLPILLIIGGIMQLGGVEPSISDFYHTTFRDVFVGTLCAIGVFLVSYRGYPKTRNEWVSDDRVATIAGLSAFGVAFFPNEVPGGQDVTSFAQALFGIFPTAVMHYVSALTFLITLAVFCLYKFPKTAKPFRKRIYRICGLTIVVTVVMVFACSWFKVQGPDNLKQIVIRYNVVFWLESIGIWAFAISWLVKGKADLLLYRAGKPKGPAQT